MEKEKIEGNGMPQAWNPSIFGMGIQGSEMNCSSEQLPNYFLNPNCDNSMDQRDFFESALSSIVSSPANSHSHPGIPIPGSGGSQSNIVLRELIGRLGSICNSGEISPQSRYNSGNDTSCYNTPLNSPPKLNLSIPGNHQLPLAPFLTTDPVFAERAARFSCFGGKIFESEFPHVMELGKLSSNQSFKTTTGSQFVGIPEENKKFSRLSMFSSQELNTEFGDHSRAESSVSEQIIPGGETETVMKSQSTCHTNGRKRKGIPKGKGKETTTSSNKVVAEDEKVESDAKKSRSGEEEEKGIEKEKGNGNGKETKENANAKPPEPPKDYIHVRARRGQATDSHSLAERVRREKISERMKFLQDLVPGCNKVTGKAVMLDEIINYVQSLQRQVEFLSMKLATVNPRLDVSMEALFSTDMFRSRASVPTSMNPFDSSAQPFPYGFQPQNNTIVPDGSENHLSVNPLMAAMHRTSIMKPSHIDGFSEASTFWENDLQSVVKMALGSQDQPQSFHGQMKVEL